jgi:ketosteroid isomerase-like protein
MDSDLELLRECFAEWGRGDFTRDEMFDPEAEFIVGGVEARTYRGREGVRQGWFDFLGAWEGFRAEAREFLEAADAGTYLVLVHLSGRGRESSVPISGEGANLVTLRDGLIVRFELFWGRDEAFEAAGLPGPPAAGQL